MFDSHLHRIPPGPELARSLAAVDIEGLGADATLSYLQAVRRQEAWTESLRLTAVAAETGDQVVDCPVPGAEQLIRPGGAGTPACGSFSADELGPALAMSRYSAARLIADALDPKYRLPQVLAAVRVGGTDAYRAQLVAAAFRHCTADTAAKVQDRVLGRLDRLTRSKLAQIVAASVAAAEPEAAEQAAATAARGRHVSLDSCHGDDIDLYATLAAGTALRLDTRVDQIADMLAVVHPQPNETKDQRRARALGLLADPETVLALARHHHQLSPLGTDAGLDDAGSEGDSPAGTPPLPATTLYVHIRPDGQADLERHGVLCLPTLQDLLSGTQLSVKPVIDLVHMPASAGYRPSDSLTEAVILTNPDASSPTATATPDAAKPTTPSPTRAAKPPPTTSAHSAPGTTTSKPTAEAGSCGNPSAASSPGDLPPAASTTSTTTKPSPSAPSGVRSLPGT